MKAIKIKLSFLITIILCLVFVVFSMQIITANTKATADTFDNVNQVEQKVFCSASIDDNFADDRILVVVNKQETLKSKKWNSTDFADYNISKVENLTESSSRELYLQLNKSKSATKNSVEVDLSKKMEVSSDEFRTILCLELYEPSKQNVLDTIRQLENREDIISAEPDYIQMMSTTTPSEYSHLPTSQRWAIDKIELPSAWDITTGLSAVTVGVIDSGIDSAHPDLTNRIDRDLSRDFLTSSTLMDQNPNDPNGHGTHVAGVIGAQGNNYSSTSTSMIGVCWTVNLASLRVFNSAGKGNTSSVVRAVDFASSVDMPILNYSGGTNFDSNALKQAIMNYQGLFVCAAGNNDRNTDQIPHYPSCYNDLDNLISVGATMSTDMRPTVNDWGYDGDGNPQGSNYGETTVDIFAPGDGIYSTYPQALSASGVRSMSGTSMATPHVAGVAALIASKYPNLDAAGIKYAILGGSTSLTISTPIGNQATRLLRADTALLQASKIPDAPKLSVESSGWRINIKNNNSQMNTIVYNERMCFEGDAKEFHHLTNLRSFKLSAEGERTVQIIPFGTATHVAAAVAFVLDNGQTIYRVAYADGLYQNGMNTPKYYTVSGGAIGNADLVPSYLRFELTARYGALPYEWDVKLINDNPVAISVTYNSRMCFDDAARNFMGLRDLVDVTVSANNSKTVRIRGNGTAQYITAAINYTVSGTRYRRVSSANGLEKYTESGVDKYRMNALRKHEVLVTSVFPEVAAEPSYLTLTPVGRSGFIWYTWNIKIQNNSGSAVEVSYNAKLCHEGDAASFEGLADIVTINISAWSSKTVTINHNGTAGWVTASLNYSYEGYENRKITYVSGLKVNPYGTGTPKHNHIQFT